MKDNDNIIHLSLTRKELEMVKEGLGVYVDEYSGVHSKKRINTFESLLDKLDVL